MINNGIRSHFKGKTGILITEHDVQQTIKSVQLVFNIFVGIIAAIAMTVAFFLLLIATS